MQNPFTGRSNRARKSSQAHEILAAFERWFPVAYLAVYAAAAWLNWDTPIELEPYFLDLRRIIENGFDPAAARLGAPAFPMWGYAFLLLLTDNHYIHLAIQGALAVPATTLLLRLVRASELLSDRGWVSLVFAVGLALPWWAFHAAASPYSIAISLIILSICIGLVPLVRGEASWSASLIAGLLFGLALNFRSDYVYLPLVLAFLTPLMVPASRRTLPKLLAWVATAYIALVPWSLYTKSATGHALYGSSNSGHVFFIGLGNLPDNRWGITPFDSDSVMQSVVDQALGPNTNTLSYAAGEVLADSVRSFARQYPGEFVRKLAHTAFLVMVEGTYFGNFDGEQLKQFANREPDRMRRLVLIAKEILRSPEAYITLPMASAVYSFAFGRIAIFLAFLALPFGIWIWTRRKNALLFVSLLLALYQTAINVGAFHMPRYTTNALLFHLLNLAVVLTWASGRSLSFRRFSLPRRRTARGAREEP